MLQPPSLKSTPRYPVTASIAGAALAVTLQWWAGGNIGAFFASGRIWEKWELWRALTSTLPHVSIFHLAFNLYWFWVFGTFLERIYGHVKFAGIVLLLAFGSSLAEFMVLNGGVGLSGVGYGLWGMLWVLERRDPRFADTVDDRTSRLFIVWFFFCVVTTLLDVLPVANIAHGVGAGLGALLGFAASSTGAARARSIAALAAACLLITAGSTLWWPWINLSVYGEAEVESAGVDAIDRGDRVTAVRYLERAVRMRHAPARAWYNLGVAYQHLNKDDAAAAAYEHAAEMPDASMQYQEAAREMQERAARRKEWRLRLEQITNSLMQATNSKSPPAADGTQAP